MLSRYKQNHAHGQFLWRVWHDYLLAKINEKHGDEMDEMEASGPAEVWQVGKLIYMTCSEVIALCLLHGLNRA